MAGSWYGLIESTAAADEAVLRRQGLPMRRVAKIAAALMLSAGSLLVRASTGGQDVIDYRQHIMKTLHEQSEAVGQILSTVVPDDNMAAHLEAIALTASTALEAFTSKVAGGESLPEVWTHWDDFSRRMNEFAQKAQKTAALAKAGHKDEEFLENITDTLDCKSCHDQYRDPTAEVDR